ncbi:MAG: hypothetical protein MK240_01050 [Opitutales bacterium]|nr:hypothetical protein [Opitutales bacterium]
MDDIQAESVGDSEGITPILLPGSLLAQIESGNQGVEGDNNWIEAGILLRRAYRRIAIFL